jgi:inorganic pyrophosphatase
MSSTAFWEALDALVSACELVIDRPCGTAHPRYPDFTYPLDYGYLQGTLSNDGSGIDIWRGTIPEKRLTAIIVNVDLQKRDSEIKLLIGCTAEEQQIILRVHDQSSWGGAQSALLITREPRPASTDSA